jgi:hypothetical protein
MATWGSLTIRLSGLIFISKRFVSSLMATTRAARLSVRLPNVRRAKRVAALLDNSAIMVLRGNARSAIQGQ